MRSDEFSGGMDAAREPQFRSIQQETSRGYVADNTLSQLIPAQNGLGAADQERRLVGYRGGATGYSPDTFQKNLWLRSRIPTARVEQTQG